MSKQSPRRNPPANQPIPVIRFDHAEADKAFEAFAELRKLAQAKPHLLDNSYFTALQDTAYARFFLNFEAAL